MKHYPPLRRRLANAYWVTGLVITPFALLLLVIGRTGTLSWIGLALGLACLLVGAAQRSSLRHR